MNKLVDHKGKKRLVTYLIIFLLASIILSVVGTGAYFKSAIYSPISNSSQEVPFTIEKGEGSQNIAKRLEQAGLIRNDTVFWLYLRFKNKNSSLQAGDYILNKSYSMIDIMQVLTNGKVVTDKITIPEGWTNKRIGEELKKRNIATAEEFEKAMSANSRDYDFLKKAPDGNLQGFLFPETYQLTSRPTADEIITKMLDEFKKRVDPKIKEKVGQNGLDYYQILTLASLVEREVPTKEDRRIVAGVFINRLKIGMKLQSDATLQYLLSSDKRIFSIEETKIESPYNTYYIDGLPPGPIANPGLEAIEAVLNPKQTDYLYFLSGKDGKTYFSTTAEEHEQKKALYL